MQKKLIVYQEGNKDCGVCCLLSIIRYYGGNISINKLLELTRTTKQGTTFYNLKEASYEVGLTGRAYYGVEVIDIPVIYLPCIAQVKVDGYTHFVVIYKILKNKVLVMDPSLGKVYIDIDLFKKMWTGYIMTFCVNRKLLDIKESKYLNKVLVSLISKNRKLIKNIIGLSVLFIIFTFLYSYYMKVIIDKAVYGNRYNAILISLVFGIIVFFKVLCNLFRNNVVAYLNVKLEVPIFVSSFKRLLLLPYSYYKNRTTGEIISRINDLSLIKNMISKLLTTVLLDVILFVVSLVFLYFINSYMFFVSIGIGVFYVIILTIYRMVIKDKIRLNQEGSAVVNSLLVEAIEGCETTKNLHIYENITKRFECSFVKMQLNVLSYNLVNNMAEFWQDIVSYLGIILINYIGVVNVINNNMTVGSLIVFNTVLDYYLSPFKNVVNLCSEYIYVKNAISRVNSLYEVNLEDVYSHKDLVFGNDIVIRDLDFSLDGRRNILNAVNLEIKSGGKVMLLGKSGDGKSTLLKVIYKYYDVLRNKIFIGGYDINDIALGDIRSKIVYVSQNEMLYTMSVRDNVTMDRDIREEDLLEVLKMIEVDNVIKDNLLGYDMMLEEGGINISGGERQRIILARALLKNSDIIMIDEGLSQMDVFLERRILTRMFDKYKDKTIIVVSHRTDNMDLYDCVIRLDNGTVKYGCSDEEVAL